MGNVVDAMYLHTALTKQGLSVDGRKVEITYCKLHQINNTSGGWKNNDNQSERYTLDDVAQLAEYSANMYAKTPAQKAHYLQYYTQYYQNQIMQGSAITLPSLNQTDRVNAAAAVAQSAIQQLHASRKLGDAEEMKGRPTPTAPSSTSLASGRVPAHASDGKVYCESFFQFYTVLHNVLILRYYHWVILTQKQSVKKQFRLFEFQKSKFSTSIDFSNEKIFRFSQESVKIVCNFFFSLRLKEP